MMHTHLIGTALKIHHLRGEMELPLLAKDDHYDFNFQETRHLPQEVAVKRVSMHQYTMYSQNHILKSMTINKSVHI